jgi:hypothetical protein
MINSLETQYVDTCKYFLVYQDRIVDFLCKHADRLSDHREKYNIPDDELRQWRDDSSNTLRRLDDISNRLKSITKKIMDKLENVLSVDELSSGINLDPNFDTHNAKLERIIQEIKNAIKSGTHDQIFRVNFNLLDALDSERNKGPEALRKRLQVSNELFRILKTLMAEHEKSTTHALEFRGIAQDQYLKYQRVMRFFGGFYDFPDPQDGLPSKALSNRGSDSDEESVISPENSFPVPKTYSASSREERTASDGSESGSDVEGRNTKAWGGRRAPAAVYEPPSSKRNSVGGGRGGSGGAAAAGRREGAPAKRK